jgi:glutathione S-transferase
MPCRDFYDDHPKQYFKDVTEPALKKQIAFAESALCQALAIIEHLDGLVETVTPKRGDFYDWINFKEAGITKAQLVKWHKDHRALDAQHREQARLKQVREAALAKLSQEERQVLGLTDGKTKHD